MGQCACEDGWTGPACGCPISNHTCLDSKGVRAPRTHRCTHTPTHTHTHTHTMEHSERERERGEKERERHNCYFRMMVQGCFKSTELHINSAANKRKSMLQLFSFDGGESTTH